MGNQKKKKGKNQEKKSHYPLVARNISNNISNILLYIISNRVLFLLISVMLASHKASRKLYLCLEKIF